HLDATQIGALAFTGADAAAAGATVADPTCTTPADCCEVGADDCPDGPVVAAVAPPGPDWVAEPELHALATQTGALASTGASTATAGETVADPTWTATIESAAVGPPSAKAGAAVARASTSPPSMSMSLTEILLLFRTSRRRDQRRVLRV